jgi:hypothetical protein
LRAFGVPGRISPVTEAADLSFLAVADDPTDLAAPSALSPLDSFHTPLATPTFRRLSLQKFVRATAAHASR